MTDSASVASDPREDLRRQWLEHANAVFDRLFPASDTPTPTFDHLEQRTVDLTTDLASWLLERRVGPPTASRPCRPGGCSGPGPASSNWPVSDGDARPVGLSFSPLDEALGL